MVIKSSMDYWNKVPNKFKPVVITVISIFIVCSIIMVGYEIGFIVGYNL